MRKIPAPMRILAAVAAGGLGATAWAEPPHNELSETEKAEGWRLLFDGESTSGWRAYGSEKVPEDGWEVVDGTLHKPAGKRAGDIMTVDPFENFELCWEWKLGARGNNGVKYFIIPERGAAVGHEYQMIDDTNVRDPYSATASFYLVVKPADDKPTRPVGEWNQSRIIVRGDHVEHWLNGKKVLEYRCGDPAIMERIQKTKFARWEGFGDKVRGHILLTDHSDPCWFRDIKLRELEEAPE